MSNLAVSKILNFSSIEHSFNKNKLSILLIPKYAFFIVPFREDKLKPLLTENKNFEKKRNFIYFSMISEEFARR